eukprot:c7512_g1_i1.p1 GENE.c7512_g1_i1~~c7512_g1_i1.p1  ORF type:complete len:209 (-),score=51.79 c7512_g1_i1:11-637(-)
MVGDRDQEDLEEMLSKMDEEELQKLEETVERALLSLRKTHDSAVRQQLKAPTTDQFDESLSEDEANGARENVGEPLFGNTDLLKNPLPSYVSVTPSSTSTTTTTTTATTATDSNTSSNLESSDSSPITPTFVPHQSGATPPQQLSNSRVLDYIMNQSPHALIGYAWGVFALAGVLAWGVIQIIPSQPVTPVHSNEPPPPPPSPVSLSS